MCFCALCNAYTYIPFFLCILSSLLFSRVFLCLCRQMLAYWKCKYIHIVYVFELSVVLFFASQNSSITIIIFFRFWCCWSIDILVMLMMWLSVWTTWCLKKISVLNVTSFSITASIQNMLYPPCDVWHFFWSMVYSARILCHFSYKKPYFWHFSAKHVTKKNWHALQICKQKNSTRKKCMFVEKRMPKKKSLHKN